VSPTGDATRLARRLGTTDAVVIGLGSMLGAGIFAVLGPAAAAAGSGLLLALLVAALVAFCNATSSAQLAALHPQSGGAYVYGRERLGARLGFVAGWGFVVGKVASCAAMALTFAAYVGPSRGRALALAAVLGLTLVNYRGVQKTALLTRVLVGVVLLALAAVVAAVLLGDAARAEHLAPLTGTGAYGVFQAAGLLFFAFAGYARIATLGEEVVAPATTIPRAIPLALGIALLVYGAVAASALLALGPEGLAAAPAPLAAAVESTGWRWLAPAVRTGAAVASLGVLLSLLVGVSRTVFAMAADGELPRWLAAVHPRYRVPHRAEVAVALAVGATVAVADVRGAIGFSSCTVLVYYAITNAAALTVGAHERRWPRALAVAGLAGCALLALTLPPPAVVAGFALLLAGLGARGAVRAFRG
jgi:APA family basic amino acid/polyamine antiporter